MSEKWKATLHLRADREVTFDPAELDALFPEIDNVEHQVLAAVAEDYFGPDPFSDEVITATDVLPIL